MLNINDLMNPAQDPQVRDGVVRAHSTPDPDAPAPAPNPNPDDVPAPANAPVQEPTQPAPPIKASTPAALAG